MDARPLGVADGFPTLVDVGGFGAGESGDCWPLNFSRYALHRRKILSADGSKACLDHVDAEFGQLLCHKQLVWRGERKPRRLLAIPQSGIEKFHVVSHSYASLTRGFVSRPVSPASLRSLPRRTNFFQRCWFQGTHLFPV